MGGGTPAVSDVEKLNGCPQASCPGLQQPVIKVITCSQLQSEQSGIKCLFKLLKVKVFEEDKGTAWKEELSHLEDREIIISYAHTRMQDRWVGTEDWNGKQHTLLCEPSRIRAVDGTSCTWGRGRRLEATRGRVPPTPADHTLASAYECDMLCDRPQWKHPRVSEGLTQTALSSNLGTVKLETFIRGCQGALGRLQVQKNEPLCLELCPSPRSSVALLTHVLVTCMTQAPYKRNILVCLMILEG